MPDFNIYFKSGKPMILPFYGMTIFKFRVNNLKVDIFCITFYFNCDVDIIYWLFQLIYYPFCLSF
jgi:hypothetical protein